jgi:hypothetical protein
VASGEITTPGLDGGGGAAVDARDAHGDTPLGWASWHQRPGAVLRLLCYGEHSISAAGVRHYTTDHGAGWGGMEASLCGKPHISKDISTG